MFKAQPLSWFWAIALFVGLGNIFVNVNSILQPSSRHWVFSSDGNDHTITKLTKAVPPAARILSLDPLIVHLTDFITIDERTALLQTSSPLLNRSTVLLPNGERIQSKGRTSSTAYLPADDPVVQTIAQRAAEWQGFLDVTSVDMQVTAYRSDQQFVNHYDWFTEPGRTTNRLSTFFATLQADCQDCGTQFPKVHVDWSKRDARWCHYVDCSKDVLTTKNIPGSAIYWRNLDEHGQGRPDTVHAGLPAANGTKIGLNIWTEVDVPVTAG